MVRKTYTNNPAANLIIAASITTEFIDDFTQQVLAITNRLGAGDTLIALDEQPDRIKAKLLTPTTIAVFRSFGFDRYVTSVLERLPPVPDVPEVVPSTAPKPIGKHLH